jgi:hypothetical protein
MGPARRRALSLVLIGLAVAACGVTPSTSHTPASAPASAQVPPTTVAASTEPTTAPPASAAANCPASADGVALNAPASGVSLAMPKGWHQMLPGDPAWKSIYGDDGSVEASIKDGTMQAFALPLDTPDAHQLSLAIYVRPTMASDVTTLGKDYADVMRRVIVTDYEPAAVQSEESIALPAGDAYRILAAMRYTGTATPRPGLPSWNDRELAYVLLRDGQSYYLVFRGKEHAFADHLDGMQCMAHSLQLADPVPSASAMP